MFCMNCGKKLVETGECPFCRQNNNILSEGSYSEAPEIRQLLQDDDDFRFLMEESKADKQSSSVGETVIKQRIAAEITATDQNNEDLRSSIGDLTITAELPVQKDPPSEESQTPEKAPAPDSGKEQDDAALSMLEKRKSPQQTAAVRSEDMSERTSSSRRKLNMKAVLAAAALLAAVVLVVTLGITFLKNKSDSEKDHRKSDRSSSAGSDRDDDNQDPSGDNEPDPTSPEPTTPQSDDDIPDPTDGNDPYQPGGDYQDQSEGYGSTPQDNTGESKWFSKNIGDIVSSINENMKSANEETSDVYNYNEYS